jgi:hypothetical protein
MQQLAPEVQRRAAELYTSGLNAARTAAEIGASKTAVLAALRRNGIPIRPAKCPHPVPIDAATRTEVERRYTAGDCAATVARDLGINQSSVFNILRQRGVRVRGLEETTRNPRHVHDLFREIDTDAKAWLLGLLSADGCVSRRSNTISLALKAVDADAVEKARAIACPSALVARKDVRDTRSRGMVAYARLSWNSAQVKSDLARCGVTPAKSKTLRPWEGPPHLMSAYWRGMLDGDGSWVRCLRKGRKSWTCTLSLTGTRGVTEGFRGFVSEHTGVRPSLVSYRGVWVCMVGNMTSLRKLIPVLYGNATVWMDRKRRLADIISATAPGRRFGRG